MKYEHPSVENALFLTDTIGFRAARAHKRVQDGHKNVRPSRRAALSLMIRAFFADFRKARRGKIHILALYSGRAKGYNEDIIGVLSERKRE